MDPAPAPSAPPPHHHFKGTQFPDPVYHRMHHTWLLAAILIPFAAMLILLCFIRYLRAAFSAPAPQSPPLPAADVAAHAPPAASASEEADLSDSSSGGFEAGTHVFPPIEAVFAPPFPKVDTNVKDLEEQHSQADCEVIGTSISLGDTKTGLPSHWTPLSGWTSAKRKLDVDFVACQDDCSVSGVKSKKNVGVQDVESPEFGPMSVKLEKD